VDWVGDLLVAGTPPAALALFESPSHDRVYFQVREEHGQLLSGWPDLSVPQVQPEGPPIYADENFRGEAVRVVGLSRRLVDASGQAVHVQIGVAATRGSFDALAWALWKPTLLRESALLLLALALMIVGLTLELRPLLRLRADLLARRDDDLGPLHTVELPRELRPVVETLNQYAARLTHQVEVQKRFIADAAHQLRTPVALIGVQLHDANRQAVDPALQHTLRALRGSQRHLAQVINQLLSLSQAEARRAARSPLVALDLAAQMRDVLEELAMLAEARGIDLGLAVVPAELPRVRAEAALLHAILFNLVDNALRYTPRGGTVTLQATAVGERVELTVVDTGPGIAAELRDRVFERFFRVDPTRHDGTGLGLSIVREAAATCRAEVRLESPAVGGLCVAVVFESAEHPGPESPDPL
jgi:two-component system sensor histidine kinase TctE